MMGERWMPNRNRIKNNLIRNLGRTVLVKSTADKKGCFNHCKFRSGWRNCINHETTDLLIGTSPFSVLQDHLRGKE